MRSRFYSPTTRYLFSVCALDVGASPIISTLLFTVDNFQLLSSLGTRCKCPAMWRTGRKGEVRCGRNLLQHLQHRPHTDRKYNVKSLCWARKNELMPLPNFNYPRGHFNAWHSILNDVALAKLHDATTEHRAHGSKSIHPRLPCRRTRGMHPCDIKGA